ncbi:MAG: hypothetical protein JZU65_19150 [Chlorobium sp.]|nr:hypothetical protein [Chlorobium sp.]
MIEIFQATDEAIALLQKYRFGKHRITRIEIAKDIICNSRQEAKQLCDEFIRTHYLKWGKGYFPISSTGYIGKREGIPKNFYVVCYVPKEGKEKLGHKYLRHTEFVILGWENIKNKMDISSIYDIENVCNYYDDLEKRYLVKTTANVKRIKKHFPNTEVRYVNEAIELISNEKERIRDRKLKHDILYTICDKRMRKLYKLKRLFKYSIWEKRILNQGMCYWVNKGKKCA